MKNLIASFLQKNMIGTFDIDLFLFVKIDAANIGKVAFFEPEILTVPNIFFPPIISNFFIN